ncbi:MAG: rRNA pseudouridine synthase [Verrucomicrobia bacterium]|nr:rRNA pseudouridine synthase [Verrucomicrobiota bacterium]
MLVRLQKFMADAGVASRRASEQLIVAGRVTVNGRIVQELGSRVDALHDQVTVDGTAIKPRRKLYVALNKPRGCICSRQDPLARRSVSDFLPKEWRNLHTVGRLDFDSEGLIFLTNDGEFSLRITHPRYGIRKKYLATVTGRVSPEQVARLSRGVWHEGETLKPDKVRLLRANNSHSLVELELSEGKNREVRRLFETLGLTVERLSRVQIGPIKLGELPSGKWRVLTPVEIASLLKSQGPQQGRLH